MGLNFPSAPTVGEVYPTPAILGVPQWTWNGTTWKAGSIDTANYLLKTGGTLTGDLTIDKQSASIYFNAATSNSTDYPRLAFNVAGKRRWEFSGPWGQETGSNVGSDISIDAYSDAGAYLSSPISIKRATGIVETTGGLSASGDIWSKKSATTGLYHFGTSGTKYIYYDGSYFNFVGGPLLFPSNAGPGSGAWYGNATSSTRFFVGMEGTTDEWRIYSAGGGNLFRCNGANANATFGGHLTINGNLYGVGPFYLSSNGHIGYSTANTGTMYFGSNGTKYLACDGTNYSFNGGQVRIVGNGSLVVDSSIRSYHGYICQQGIGGGGSNTFNWFWNNSQMVCWVDQTNVGYVTLNSDYRIKKDVLDLPGMWDRVKALRPISYHHNNWTPPWEIDSPVRRADMPDLFVEDGVDRWGFIAHELQETLIMDAATGTKDAENLIQSPNQWTVIAALTKALQEAMTRIEALEAA